MTPFSHRIKSREDSKHDHSALRNSSDFSADLAARHKVGRFTLNFVDLTTVSVKSVGTLLSPCPLNVGVKDLLSYLRQTKLGERGDERERKK